VYDGVVSLQGVDFDGSMFNIYDSEENFDTQLFRVLTYDYNVTYGAFAQTNMSSTRPFKRAITHFVDNGPVTAILRSYAGGTGNILVFNSPTFRDYSFLQFAGVNIRVQAGIPPPVIGPPPVPGFIYYYATGLPQGVSLIVDISGQFADISGIPTLYDSSFKGIELFARTTTVPYSGNTTISYRVLSPFVLKPQSGASGYTAFLRQYTEVNAAQNARDSVVLPVEERSIGTFTSPGIPDVITKRVDPKCFSTSNCT
jgi:hypothetical protein